MLDKRIGQDISWIFIEALALVNFKGWQFIIYGFGDEKYIKKIELLIRKYNLEIEHCKITAELLKTFDCVLLLTDHDDFPYELIKKNSNLIIDTRGRFNLSENIYRA